MTKRFQVKCYVLILLTSLVYYPVFNAAQGQTPEKELYLTLEQSVSRALKQNSQVRSSKFALDKARWDKRHAWSLLFPSLSLNSRMTRIDEQTFAERDFRRYLPPEIARQIPQTVFQESYFTSLDVSMPVFNSALLNGISISRANERIAGYMNKSARENTIFMVIRSYLDVLRNNEILTMQNEALELAQLNIEKAQRMYDAGRYSTLELLRWKIEYQQQKSVVISSESALRNETANLKRLVNTPQESILQVENKIPQFLQDICRQFIGLSREAIMDIIEMDNGELIASNAGLSAARDNEKISRLLYRDSYYSYLPSINLSYSHGWRENSTPALDDYSPKMVMLTLSLPVFNSFQKLSSLKSTYYVYRENQEHFNGQLRNTRILLTETANRILDLKTQQELASANVEYNEHHFRIISQQREQDLVSNIDYIDAQLDLQEARINDISVNYDLISAIVELYYFLSKLESLF